MSRDALLAMLTREQALRDSDAVQARYDDYHGRGMASPEAIEIDVQRQVLREHGYADCDASLGRYWQIAAKWIDAPNASDDPELRKGMCGVSFTGFCHGNRGYWHYSDAQQLDWARFNAARVSEWFEWLRGRIHHHTPASAPAAACFIKLSNGGTPFVDAGH